MCNFPRSELKGSEVGFLIREAVFTESFGNSSFFGMNGIGTLFSETQWAYRKTVGVCLEIVFLCRSDGCHLEACESFPAPTHSAVDEWGRAQPLSPRSQASLSLDPRLESVPLPVT